MTLSKPCLSDKGRPFLLTLEAYGPTVDVLERLGYVSEHSVEREARKERERERLRVLRETQKEKEVQLELEIWGK